MKSKPTIGRRFLIAGVTLMSAAAASAAPKGDATHGQQLFARCAACHVIGATPGTRMGPNLNGVFGRKAGTLPGYTYSAAMKKFGLTWDAPTLARFLQAPMKVVPGTKMAFPGLSNAQDQADVVAYLKQYRANGTKK
ncbi:c-type cytochrome [Sphingomonas sp.]|uniref:c-type cytochrome n=1 Tax=Sphingomonas sp. TaxID=28214 RepID=UPI003B3A2329